MDNFFRSGTGCYNNSINNSNISGLPGFKEKSSGCASLRISQAKEIDCKMIKVGHEFFMGLSESTILFDSKKIKLFQYNLVENISNH